MLGPEVLSIIEQFELEETLKVNLVLTLPPMGRDTKASCLKPSPVQPGTLLEELLTAKNFFLISNLVPHSFCWKLLLTGIGE